MANETDTGNRPQCTRICVATDTTEDSDSIIMVGSLTKMKYIM